METKDCPCCSGAGVHRKQSSVDDFIEVGCGSCVEGQVSVCGVCKREDEIHAYCLECDDTGLEDYSPCDLAKTLERKRVRPASEDFK